MRHLAIVSILAFTLCGCRDDGKPAPKGELVSHDDAQEILESTPWLDKLFAEHKQKGRKYRVVHADGQGGRIMVDLGEPLTK